MSEVKQKEKTNLIILNLKVINSIEEKNSVDSVLKELSMLIIKM